ncbi:hypothetical protein [Magnetospirillum sp. SS-4]|uniref:hypothetical protein n=1 Tax=Magnetospirillum sp. SS-4 TaxID=2681465 RepID=UPI0013843903|nr:hypothetical protein [Magnetospirillum sp. SS-4]CAA7625204.1 conserved exported hypothetical protein [Magnetospirillum sp. SS-4]
MIRRLLSLGAATLAALAGGCGDGPSTVPGGYRSPATWSSFVYATSSGPLLLEVRGDPFGTGTARLEAAVAASMAAALPGRPFAMTTDASQAPRPAFRVTVVLGPARDLDDRDICAGRAVPVTSSPGDGGRVDVAAAFCDGSSLLSSSRGWVAKVEDIDDRRFRRMLEQIARDLMGDPQ